MDYYYYTAEEVICHLFDMFTVTKISLPHYVIVDSCTPSTESFIHPSNDKITSAVTLTDMCIQFLNLTKTMRN